MTGTRSGRALMRRVAKRLRGMKDEKYDQRVYAQRGPCGTVCCLAGHVVLLKDRKLPRDAWYGSEFFNTSRIYARARTLFGISDLEALKLFTAGGFRTGTWPEPYASRWSKGEEPKRLIAADLLDDLASGKVSL